MEPLYLINDGGVVHSVNPEEADLHLSRRGARSATPEEVAAWYTAQGLPVPGSDGATAATGNAAETAAPPPVWRGAR